MRNKILSLLVVLLTAVTGAWAQVPLEVTEITIPDSWANDDTKFTTADTPGFIPMTADEVKTWDNIPPTGIHVVIHEMGEQGNCVGVMFYNGAFYLKGQFALDHKAMYKNAHEWGYTYYYTGAPANVGSPVDITWDAETNTASFDAMPAGNVTVHLKYYSLAGVTLAESGEGGTATLLDETFKPLTADDKITEGERFVLKLVLDENHGFNVRLKDLLLEQFSVEDNQRYLAYARENNIEVPANTFLMWVTMPDTNDKDLTVPVSFQEEKPYTVMYQPTGNPTDVWCRIGIKVNNEERFNYGRMVYNSQVGDATVWSLSVSSAFDPTKVAFFTSEEAAKADDAVMSAAVISQSTNTWTTVDGGKYVIIGGNAKAVVAAFVTDASAAPVYNSETATYDYVTDRKGVTYQFTVCGTDDAGNVTSPGSVTVPAAPAAPVGKEFVTWSALIGEGQDKTEQTYTAGQTVNIRENTTISAIWKPTMVNVKLDLNGGTGIENTDVSVEYNTTLNVANPTRKGFSFEGWRVNEAVLQGSALFGKGSTFDTSERITANMSLTAQWKHAHDYACYPISKFPESMGDYLRYSDNYHVAVCACGSIGTQAHHYDANGKCACQTPNPAESTAVTFEKSYGRWSNGNFSALMHVYPMATKKNNVMSASAPHTWGNLEFLKWQSSTDGGTTWKDLSAHENTSLPVTCNMKVRALYVTALEAQVSLRAYHYDDQAQVNGQTYVMDNVLFQMNYKLPDGYTFVDAGVIMGDNEGISYYELKSQQYKLDGATTAITVGILSAVSVFSGDVTTMALSGKEKKWEKRENNALDEMSAATLAKFIYEGKPVNWQVETFYWEAKVPTKGQTGSVATTPPLRFIQKNNGNHYIYGVGYLKYKKPGGKTEVIYTDALPATRDNIPNYTVTKTEKVAGARLMAPARSLTSDALRAPEENATNNDVDLRLVSAPETELDVYVDGKFSAELSDRYGFGDDATLVAPAVSGKTFSHWEADGNPVSSNSELKLTMNAHTKLCAVYGSQSANVPTAGFTSVNRTIDGSQISFQAIADAEATEAGIIYSTTATGDALTIDGAGVTKVAAERLTESSNENTDMPESILDRNNNWMLQITPESANTVYHARVYANIGGNTVYGDVRDVTLATLKSGISYRANLDAFEPDLNSVLKAVQQSGEAKPKACFLIDEVEPTAVEGVMAGQQEPIVTAGQTSTGTVMYAIGQSATETPALADFTAELPTAAAFADDYTQDVTAYVYYYIQAADGYVDSDISAPIAVTLTKNKFDIQFNAANANTIEAGKATVTVGGTAATVTEGKLEGVKMGSEVKMTAKDGYKFRKVEVKKSDGSKRLDESTVGMIVCTNGKAYPVNMKDNLPSGVTAVGIVAYKNGKNGLVMALTDEATNMNWDTATGNNGAKAHTPAVEGYSWKVPTIGEWQYNIFTGAGVGNLAGLSTYMTAAGGTGLQDGCYWTSTPKNNGYYARCIKIENGSINFSPGGNIELKTNGYHVRAVFAF